MSLAAPLKHAVDPGRSVVVRFFSHPIWPVPYFVHQSIKLATCIEGFSDLLDIKT